MKIFDISLPRTGTRSLTAAMEVLGYKSAHGPETQEEKVDLFRKIIFGRRDFQIVKDYDFVSHVGPFFRTLDQVYDARFILLTRDIVKWLRSCRLHWHKKNGRRWKEAINGQLTFGALRRMLEFEGAVKFNRDHFRRCYRNHYQAVTRHFRRSKKLLVMDIQEGWEPLCRFLNRDIPDIPFPRVKRDRRQYVSSVTGGEDA